MVRCAQPLVGMKRSRSHADELYLAECGVSVIFDARPRRNAVANMVMGKGYELVGNYADISLQFLDIENIHVQRESLGRLLEATMPSMVSSTYSSSASSASSGSSKRSAAASNQWLAAAEASAWLRHVASVLRGADLIAQALVDGKSAVVHCSDGWDRTAQLCALAQIMLDPFTRTLRGLAMLIEKDWLSFGHMFQKRLGHANEGSADQRSPVFLQWLDALHQLQHQFPSSFEYNERLLVHIFHTACSGAHGTFLFDSDRERCAHAVPLRCPAIWREILDDPLPWCNSLYRPHGGNLQPATCTRALQVWRSMYCQWDPAQQPLEHAEQRELALMQRMQALEARAAELETECVQLRAQQVASHAASGELQLQVEAGEGGGEE